MCRLDGRLFNKNTNARQTDAQIVTTRADHNKPRVIPDTRPTSATIPKRTRHRGLRRSAAEPPPRGRSVLGQHPERHVAVEDPGGVEVLHVHQHQVERQQPEPHQEEQGPVEEADGALRQVREEPEPLEAAGQELGGAAADEVVVEVDARLGAEGHEEGEDEEEAEELDEAPEGHQHRHHEHEERNQPDELDGELGDHDAHVHLLHHVAEQEEAQ